jgi:predicted acylesterase/phospholipase RssA
LCACSALPFIEQTVKIDEQVYCEGALVDTLNFRSLLEDHAGSINEIWINRIVDSHQIKQPKNLHDALANLCQLFAATVGEDDIKLFKLYARENNRQGKRPHWTGTIVTVQVDPRVDFHWDEKNLRLGRKCGFERALDAIKLYKMYKNNPPIDGVLLIPDDLSIDDIKKAGVPVPADREREGA